MILLSKVLLLFNNLKIIDFVGGLSDIRDSHATYGIRTLFPSMARIFVGIFIIFL